MVTQVILEIGKYHNNGLYIKPAKTSFPLIYREANGINWDVEKRVIYSEEPREWSYSEWFKFILEFIRDSTNCELILTNETKYFNLSSEEEINIKSKYEELS